MKIDSITVQDPADQALLDEFGSYLSRITERFTEPLQTALKNAEADLLETIAENQEAIEKNHEEDLASLRARHDELKKVAEQFSNFLSGQEQRLKKAEENFRDDLKKAIESQVACQVDKLQRQVETMTTRVNITLAIVTLLLIVLPFLQLFVRR
jgi:hypothetical protein